MVPQLMQKLNKEQKLLLLLARSGFGGKEKKEALTILHSKPNFEIFRKLALRSRIAPLLHHNLRRVATENPALVPAKILHQLQKRHKESTIHNLIVFGQAQKLLLTLRKVGIPAIIPKGISTSQKFSHDNLKGVGDIDLLVKKEDINRLEKVLAGLGWKAVAGYKKIKQERFRNNYQLPQFAIAGATLDTHWNLCTEVKIDAAELWEDAVPFNFEGAKALELSPEKNLCYLCIHSSLIHGFDFFLRDLADINETILHYGKKINWEKLCAVSKKWKTCALVYFCLCTTHEKFGNSQIPKKTLERLRKKSNKMHLLVLSLLGESLLVPLPRTQMRVLRFFLKKTQKK